MHSGDNDLFSRILPVVYWYEIHTFDSFTPLIDDYLEFRMPIPQSIRSGKFYFTSV
jgi:hypothetical protein